MVILELLQQPKHFVILCSCCQISAFPIYIDFMHFLCGMTHYALNSYLSVP